MSKHRIPTLDRRKVVAALLKQRGDALVVAGLGAPCFDVMACGDNPLNFYTWGAMGGTASTEAAKSSGVTGVVFTRALL